MTPTATARSWLTRLGRCTAPIALAGALLAGPAAAADPPRADAPAGAAATITTPEVGPTGVVSFTGTGFLPGGKTVSVKVDDEQILHQTAPRGIFTTVTSAADGTIAGSVDLSQALAATPVAPGTHWLRFLAPGHTVHAGFTVIVPAAAAFPVGEPGPPLTQTRVDAAPIPTPTQGRTPTPSQSRSPAPEPQPGGGPLIVTGGPVQLRATALAMKRSRVTLKLSAGPMGSAGTVRIRSKNAYRIGKGVKRRRVLFASDAYFVERVGRAAVKLRLTADGRALFTRKKELKAVVDFDDASEVRVRQPVVISR